MNLTLIDWIIIGLYFVISLVIGFVMSKKAGKSTGDFFLSGRKLPWYIAGTSMVATTFAADTPLAVTELVAKNGIAGNWIWWNMIFGGMLTVFFFARLWRRSGIVTDAEFVSIRYSGKAANFLRGFRSIYIGIIMNVVVIAWVNLAMVKIIKVMFPELTFFGIDEISIGIFTFDAYLLTVGALLFFVSIYSSLSGLWGVSLTDSFQFLIAMTACIILAIFALNHPSVGGISGLKKQLPDWVFSFFPTVGEQAEKGTSGIGIMKMTVTAFIAYLGVQWWASWYPGAEPGGGGYVAQRMMSAKDERNSVLATLWFQIAHFALRPWPWIIVALVSLVLYPDLPPDQRGEGFVMVIRDLLPSGLLGLLLAAFLAAFMSTIASQTVWGTSYIVNDLFRPFIKKNGSEKYYVKVARITTFILMFISLIVTSQINRISAAWEFVLACSGGIGLVLILRWFWWRINAWSEIAAIASPFFIYVILAQYDVKFPDNLLIIVGGTTVIWLLVTFLTPPTEEEQLIKFYKRVRPGGSGWKRIAKQEPEVKTDGDYLRAFVNWFCGCLSILLSLFGMGKIIFGDTTTGLIMFAIAFIGAFVIYKNMSYSFKKEKETN